MAARLGIELSPTACRIIEIDGTARWVRPAETRVRSFAVLPPSGAELSAKLASLKGRAAAVIVWNAAAEHRQVVVTSGTYEPMRREALTALATAGLRTKDVLADIAPAAGRPQRGRRQPVVVVLASAAEISSALDPLRGAGIHVRTVTTPAVALDSLARLRRTLAVAGAIEAYITLEPHVSCVTLVRDSVLVAARVLRWGYADMRGDTIATRSSEEIASRLSADISEFVTAIGGEPHDIGQVCVMGGLPELRSMTAFMTEHLDVEVEPLDSMFAIDVAHLPVPAAEFRDRCAELRLAWAAAADWPPAINLLRARHRDTSRVTLGRAAVAAGVAAGVLVGWGIERSQWWQSPGPTPVPRTAAVKPTPRRPEPSPAIATNVRQPAPQPPQTPAVAPPSTRREPAIVRVEPPPLRAEPAPSPRPPADPPRRAVRAQPVPQAEPGPATPAVLPQPSNPSLSRIGEEPIPVTADRPVRLSRARSAAPPDAAVPFDAALGTILYSSDRKLAIVDGRIVGIGDEVHGARVVDITPATVILRDAQGRLRRLTLGSDAR